MTVSSIALQCALASAALVLALPAVNAHEAHEAHEAQEAPAAQRKLVCDNLGPERAALKQAPKGVRRVGKHVLEVALDKGKQRFVDAPPYNDSDGMGGVQWRYCGYDAQARAHLIGKSEGFSFSGELLLENGKRLQAGHTVLFAPVRTAYLAIEQEDGRDGEDWSVRDIAGKTLWKGYGGTLAMVDGISSIVSTFEHPAWTAQGELSARYTCLSSERGGVVTLARTPSGTWRWRGHGKC